ncbi:MAG: hypothetical protein H0W74_13940 [Sphingosinicella sp.]|nr:hypothetical protein [Sphingosinicella sp.]
MKKGELNFYRLRLSFAPFIMGIALLSGCGGANDADPQPTPAEVKAYLAKVDHEQARARAKAIRESRAKEEKVKQEHLREVPARN